MTTLAGKVLDDAGLPIEGAAVAAKDTLDGTTKGTTSTNSDGVWVFDDLNPLEDGIDYYVEVTWNGKTKQLWGLSAIQLAYLTIGKQGLTVDPTGNLTLRQPVDPSDNDAVASPALKLVGAHDSNAAGGAVTRTDVSLALYLDVNPQGGSALYLKDGSDTHKVKFDGDTGVVSKRVGEDWVAASYEGHTHAGSADAAKLISNNGQKWAWTDDNGVLWLPGGKGGIKKIKYMTISGPGTYAHGLGEAPNVVLAIARGPTAYFSVGHNNADANNIYINASQNSEMKVLMMVVANN